MKFSVKLTRVAFFTLIFTLVTFASTTLLGGIVARTAQAAWDITVYQEGFGSGWQNWSWSSSVSTSNTWPVYGGKSSIKVTPNAWGALYLHNGTSVTLSDYDKLQFQLYVAQSSPNLKIVFYDSSNNKVKESDLKNYGTYEKDKWKEFNVPFSILSGASSIKGFAIQNNTSNTTDSFYLDNIYIKVKSSSGSTTPTPTPTPTPEPAPSPVPSPVPSTGAGYTTSNGVIYQSSNPVKVKGVNWFGFEGSTRVAHGLWVRNWKDMISQMKTLGFNSVRIPYCPKVLDGDPTNSINYSLNSDLQGLNSLQVLDKIVNEFSNQKMNVLLDVHTPDCVAISDLWYTGSYSETSWIDDLKFVAQRYKSIPYFMGIDIKNEPKGIATWGTGTTSTDWKLAAEKAGKAILGVNPNILIFVEGVENNSNCTSSLAHWWGGNLEPASCKPISTDSIPANKLVYAPHIYGPDVYAQPYFSDSNFPNNMPTIWTTQFGFLADKGNAVVPTEWGGKYGNGGVAKDVTWQNALVSYYKSKKMCSTFYWDWNPNSGDTGGVLQDDWKTPWDNKVKMLNDFYSSCSQ